MRSVMRCSAVRWKEKVWWTALHIYICIGQLEFDSKLIQKSFKFLCESFHM